MIEQHKETKKITVTYTDGSEKVVDRGVCFSVHEDDERVFVLCDGIAGSEYDEIAILTIVASIAKEMGVDENLVDKAEPAEGAEE